MTPEPDDDRRWVSRRLFMRGTGGAAGAGLLVVGSGAVGGESGGSFDPQFASWRVREARKVWARGLRGRPDRAVTMTNTGVDARHPDIGPFNGVAVELVDGTLVERTDEGEMAEAEGTARTIGGELGPGLFAEAARPRRTHEFTAPDNADVTMVHADMTWEPRNERSYGPNDLEFYLDRWRDDGWERVAESHRPNQPEVIRADAEPNGTYRWVVEPWLNTYSEYEIEMHFMEWVERPDFADPATAVSASIPADPRAVDHETPKVVGWFQGPPDHHGTAHAPYEAPRDPDGHGTHVTGVMAGSGRASAVDPGALTRDAPRTVLLPGDVLSYEVDATVYPEDGTGPPRAGETGVFATAYGTGIELVIEGPEGRQLDAAGVGFEDTSLQDSNVAQTPTVHDTGTVTYNVYVRPATGEAASTARVESVRAGAFRPETGTVGLRVPVEDGGDPAVHAGVAPNASVVGAMGDVSTTHQLGAHAEAFASTFGLRAVNMSWGFVYGYPLGQFGGHTGDTDAEALVTSIRRIAEGGMLPVAAVGNNATPATGNDAPSVADEAVATVAAGPLDGITGYAAGSTAALDEDHPPGEHPYFKPDVTAPGGPLTDLTLSAAAGRADVPEPDQPPIRDYTREGGSGEDGSVDRNPFAYTPFVTGTAALVAEAMEFGRDSADKRAGGENTGTDRDAPAPVSLPAPEDTTYDDVMRLKQVLLATASETAFTAAPYHRGKAPTYDFGGRDPYEGYGRVNPEAAVDAVTRDLTGTDVTVQETVGLDVPRDSRAVAGYVEAEPGTVTVEVDFDRYTGGNRGMTKGAPHVDLFVYDAEAPRETGDPRIVARAAGVSGAASTTLDVPAGAGSHTYLVVAKLVNVPGVVNGYDVRAHIELRVAVEPLGTVVSGTREESADVFTGGQTERYDIDVTVERGDAVRIRDQVPEGWTVLTAYGAALRTSPRDGGGRYVYFDADGDGEPDEGTDHRVTYYVEAPEDEEPTGAEATGTYRFGPVQYTADDGDASDARWSGLPGTADANVVVGRGTDG